MEKLDLKKYPSLWNETKHPSLSEQYRPVRTMDYIDILQKDGWGVLGVSERKVTAKKIGNEPFTKHLVILSRLSDKGKNNLSKFVDYAPAVVLTNAGDGFSALKVYGGARVKACSNTVIFPEKYSQVEQFRAVHREKAIEEWHSGFHLFLERLTEADKEIQKFKDTVITPKQAVIFAKIAKRLRFEETADTSNKVSIMDFPEDLLLARDPVLDPDDSKLWGVFNIVQRKLIQGTKPFIFKNLDKPRSRSVKPLTESGKLVSFNQELFGMASKFRKNHTLMLDMPLPKLKELCSA